MPLVRYRSIVADNQRWDGFRLRPGDIIISTPPKCGTTWTQMICALLVFQTPELDRPLDLISPWLDMQLRPLDEVVADLEAQTHRRFIKTHTPADGLPWSDDVTYICVGRDPRDVAMSWDNHEQNIDAEKFMATRAAAVGLDDLAELMPDGPLERSDDPHERYRRYVTDDDAATGGPPTLAGVLHHMAAFWELRERPNVILLHYADLKADLDGQMRLVAARLGIEVPEERWPDLVRAATFDSMRERAVELAPASPAGIWQDTTRFFNKGTSGQWRDMLGDEDLELYRRRADQLADPALLAWLER